MLLLLSIIALFVAAAGGQTCEDFSFELSKNESSCFSHAIFLNPSHFEQFSNRTCALYRVCSKIEKQKSVITSDITSIKSRIKLNQRNGTYVIRKEKSTTRFEERTFNWRCPSYEQIPVNKEILLLRTHVSSKISPYFLLMQGNVSQLQMSVNEADRKRTSTFKSPLLGSDAYRRRLKTARVEMRFSHGPVGISLGFSFKPSDSLPKGQWFSNKRLVSSKPWADGYMRNENYEIFSVKGVETSKVIRRFYVNLSYRSKCSDRRGYMAVVERAACPYEKKAKNHPAYLFNYGLYNVRRWATHSMEAAEFRIYGTFRADSQSDMFVRKREFC